MRSRLPALLLGSALAASASAAADAATLIGLTSDNHIIRIDTETRRASAPVRVSGAAGKLVGIDMRPADGKLYGLTDSGQIVVVDSMTGLATKVSQLNERFEGGGRAVVDFNPAADRLRVMGMNGANLRVNAQTGEAAKDGRLKYAAGTPWAETAPRVVAGAYTNSAPGAQQTTLLTIDSLTRTLNLQAPPNDGVQQPRGEVARSLPAGVAFDILADGQGNNRGFLLAEGMLHDVDLQGGRAMAIGAVSGLPGGAEVIDIAATR
ncbi:MAG: DUF4394 domain-containing protein [Acetobacteraceae bacterium]|nr:DUF4394 domain-containing protein [Acetobacteraceae bacterium]